MLSKISDTDFLDYARGFDIIGLCETWSSNFDYSTVFTDYVCYCVDAFRLSSHGRLSGGILLMIRNNFKHYVKMSKLCSNCIFILLDKCFLVTDKDVLLGFVYIHPENSSWYKHQDNHCGIDMFQEELTDVLQLVGNVPVLLGGDFNARTGLSLDFVEDVILSALNMEYCDFMSDCINIERFSCDKVVNNYGKRLVDLCSAFNLTIFNGRCGSDKNVGDFTFISSLGASVIDYVIGSSDMFTLCEAFDIESRSESPHLPITCKFQSRDVIVEPPYARALGVNFKFSWDSDCDYQFRSNLFSSDVTRILDDCVIQALTDVNKAIEMFNNALYQAADFTKKRVFASDKTNQPWFDDECKFLRQESKRLLKIFRTVKDSVSRNVYVDCRNKYKSLSREKKRLYNMSIKDELMKNISNAKNFWNTFKKVHSWKDT